MIFVEVEYPITQRLKFAPSKTLAILIEMSAFGELQTIVYRFLLGYILQEKSTGHSLIDGEAAILKNGAQPLTDEIWSELKAAYEN